MIGHEHVGMERERTLSTHAGQIVQHPGKIRRIAKDRSTVDSSLQDMVHAAGQCESGKSCHRHQQRRRARALIEVNSEFPHGK
jgi:hypothetical protein